MNVNKELLMTDRMAKNIEFFSNKVKNEKEKIAISTMIEILDGLLNEIIKAKIVKSFDTDTDMENIAYNQSASFNAKIEACFQLKAIGLDVREILINIDTIKVDFQSFNDFNTRIYIERVVKFAHSDLFEMMLNMIKNQKIPNMNCDKLDDLINTLGYRGTLQFVFVVIAAALVENLLFI